MALKRFQSSGKKVPRELPGDTVTGVSDADQLTHEGARLFYEGMPLTYSE